MVADIDQVIDTGFASMLANMDANDQADMTNMAKEGVRGCINLVVSKIKEPSGSVESWVDSWKYMSLN